MLQSITQQLSVARNWRARERKYERAMKAGSEGNHTHFSISQNQDNKDCEVV